jgi:hypothetical protein
MSEPNKLCGAGGQHSITGPRRERLRLDEEWAVAALIGRSAPMSIMAAAFGAEVSSWTVTRQKLQRTAGAAGLAAAEAYDRGASATIGATYGAYAAEMSGASGAAGRSGCLLVDRCRRKEPSNSASIVTLGGVKAGRTAMTDPYSGSRSRRIRAATTVASQQTGCRWAIPTAGCQHYRLVYTVAVWQ